MREDKATSVLPWLGAVMLFSALMEFLSIQNELFRLVFYWTYLACIPGVGLLLMSLCRVNLASWRQLFYPSAMFCFLMPFVCWRERTLSEGLHIYVCCHLLFVALFWLLFAVIGALRELYPESFHMKWLRQVVLYVELVPCCAVIFANLGTTVKEKGFQIMSSGFWIIWFRVNLGMMYIRYLMVISTVVVALYCIVLYLGIMKTETPQEDENGD